MDGCSQLNQFSTINGKSKKSFAAFTIKERLPYILRKISKENCYPDDVQARLDELGDNILHGKIGLLPESGEEILDWQNWINPFMGKSWFELPFYFAEAYFYRMVLDRSGYFEDKIDPFAITKRHDILDNREQFSAILKSQMQFHQKTENKYDTLRHILQLCLWGNKSDLSQLSVNRKESNKTHSKYTLIDNSKKIGALLATDCSRVDIVLDNSGIELFTDLVLADMLISLGFTRKVVLHAKTFPTFVSDATIVDIGHVCEFLSKHPEGIVQEFEQRIKAHISSGSIKVMDHVFWNAPLHFCEMQGDLYLELQKSDLIIFKGDANYRRIFGDGEIPLSFPVTDITSYLPATSIAIRILKSEIMTGLTDDETRKTKSYEPNWQTNGKYGIIQLIKS